MPLESLAGVGIGNSVTMPEVVILPILLVSDSVNQSAPSGPEVMSQVNVAVGEGKEYSVIAPKVVILPITRPSVNRKRLTNPGCSRQRAHSERARWIDFAVSSLRAALSLQFPFLHRLSKRLQCLYRRLRAHRANELRLVWKPHSV